MPVDDDPHVACKKEIRERGQTVPALVEQPGDGADRFLGAFDQHFHQLLGGPIHQLLGKRAGRSREGGARRQKLSHVLMTGDVAQQVAGLVHGGKPLQHRHHLAMLRTCRFEFDDVFVEKVSSGARCYGEDFLPGLMNQDVPELTDFRGNVNRGHVVESKGSPYSTQLPAPRGGGRWEEGGATPSDS